MTHQHNGARSVVRTGLAVAAGVGLAAGVEVATYPGWRRWCRQWGATDQEAAQELPGDDLLAEPQVVTTRAITIWAPTSLIWPWLVQMGPGRGGAYTYDWIEGLLGLGMHSASEILPQFQDLRIGDTQHLGKNGPVMKVAILQPERSLVLRSEDGNWVWAFALHPIGGRTRLLSRNRIAAGPSPLARVATTYLMEPGSLIMERKMLIGIRRRAERLARGETLRGLPLNAYAF